MTLYYNVKFLNQVLCEEKIKITSASFIYACMFIYVHTCMYFRIRNGGLCIQPSLYFQFKKHLLNIDWMSGTPLRVEK